MKFDDRLANKVIKKEEFEQQQQKLRKKYDVEEEGIIRIEKKRLTEVLIKNITILIKTILGIIHILLSALGAICILYPDTRVAMYNVVKDLIQQAINLLGLWPGHGLEYIYICSVMLRDDTRPKKIGRFGFD